MTQGKSSSSQPLDSGPEIDRLKQPLLSRYYYFILLAFITGNSRFEPLLEGLFAQIHIDLS